MNVKNVFGYTQIVFGAFTVLAATVIIIANGSNILKILTIGEDLGIIYRLLTLLASVYCISFLLLGFGFIFAAVNSKKQSVKKMPKVFFIISFIFFIFFMAGLALKWNNKTVVKNNEPLENYTQLYDENEEMRHLPEETENEQN